MLVCLLVQDKVIAFLDELSDEALKKEATSEAKSDTFSSIMKVRSAMLMFSGSSKNSLHVSQLAYLWLMPSW